MNFKKILCLILVLAAALTLAFTAVSCKDKVEKDEKRTEKKDDPEKPEKDPFDGEYEFLFEGRKTVLTIINRNFSFTDGGTGTEGGEVCRQGTFTFDAETRIAQGKLTGLNNEVCELMVRVDTDTRKAHLVKETAVYPDGKSETTVYNENGKPSESVSVYEDEVEGRVVEHCFFEYDENGNLAKKTFVDENGDPLVVYWYYENGEEQEVLRYRDGVLYNDVRFDENGETLEETDYYENGRIKTRMLYKDGKAVEKIFYAEDGTVERTIVFGEGTEELRIVDGTVCP